MRKIKTHKISFYALWCCLGIATLIFGTGAIIGYDDIVGETLISGILWLLYLLIACATAFIAFNIAKNARRLLQAFRNNDRERLQIGKTNIIASVILLLSLAIGIGIAIASKDDTMVKATVGEQISADTFIVSSLLMIIATTITVALNSIGILKKRSKNEKKA